MVDINAMFPSKFISAHDLRGPIDVVMGNVEMVDVDGRGEIKPTLFFQNAKKGLVLNKTNANRISDMYGSDTSAWFGRTICLYPSETEFQGRTVDCIRVNAPGNQMVSAWKQAQAGQAPVQPANGGIQQPAQNNDAFGDTGSVSQAIDDEIPF